MRRTANVYAFRKVSHGYTWAHSREQCWSGAGNTCVAHTLLIHPMTIIIEQTRAKKCASVCTEEGACSKGVVKRGCPALPPGHYFVRTSHSILRAFDTPSIQGSLAIQYRVISLTHEIALTVKSGGCLRTSRICGLAMPHAGVCISRFSSKYAITLCIQTSTHTQMHERTFLSVHSGPSNDTWMRAVTFRVPFATVDHWLHMKQKRKLHTFDTVGT